MSVTGTLTQLRSIALASSGIVSAPADLPGVLNTVNLPCAIIRPGPAQWNEHAQGLYRQIRTYAIEVYVAPTGQGAGIDQGFQACLAPLNALGRTFLDNYSLNNTVDEVRQPFRDSGVVVLTYGSTPYHGFVLEIDVTEKST